MPLSTWLELAKSVKGTRLVFSRPLAVPMGGGATFCLKQASLQPSHFFPTSSLSFRRARVSPMADEQFSPRSWNATAYGVSPVCVSILFQMICTVPHTKEKSTSERWYPLATDCRIFGTSSLESSSVSDSPRECHTQVFNVWLTDENYRISELLVRVAETRPWFANRIRPPEEEPTNAVIE